MIVPTKAKAICAAFLDVFYPNKCQICEVNLHLKEYHVCSSCAYDLPYIEEYSKSLQQLAQLFWGRVVIKNVFSLLNYQSGNQTQRLLHLLKYHKKIKLGVYFGELLGEVISKQNSIDFILPVPLHPKKKRERGFNQSEQIAIGIANNTGIPVLTKVLKREKYNLSQTRFSKYDRWENVRKIFSLIDKEIMKDKHVLLVDDVLTTGATLEACALELLKVENCTVSIATLAARV